MGVISSLSSKAGTFSLLLIIVALAAILSVVSYANSLATIDQIAENVGDEVRRVARIEAFHIRELLENRIGIVNSNAETSANLMIIKSGDVERGADIINRRQDITNEITDRYFWLDESGRTIWSSAFTSETELALYRGFDASDRPYFVNPANTGKPYFSPLIVSPDGAQRLFLSHPILDREAGAETFKGVIVASIRADTLGSLVESELSPEIESSIGIISPSGVIIYATNASFIGENLFGDRVQAALSPAFSSPEELSEFNDFLTSSLQGGSDSKDFTGNGLSSTVTYSPIFIKDESANDHHYLTLYLTAPHNLASEIGPIVDQEKNFSAAVIMAIAATTILVAFILITWNKRLGLMVAERTASLLAANESLSSLNKALTEKQIEIKQANEQLRIHDRMQKDFINVTAHELRTPTQAILGYAELLESSEIDSSPEDYKAIARNAKRLQRLTEDILDTAKIESGNLVLRKEKFSIDELVIANIQDAKSLVASGKVKFEYEPTGIMIEADADRISQVISNLISNSVKSTKEGTIAVSSSIEDNGDHLALRVRDTGAGIDHEILPKLFDKFTTKSEKGTGLGLFIAKGIAEAHGGTLVARNNEDRGATFTLRLPLPSQSTG
ncbi:MAG TPA: sensor histidine kinase [Nitrososphaera sp.]